MTTTVRSLMTTAPFTVSPDELVGNTRDMMLESGVHCVPVTDTEGHPIGIVTSWDLVEEYAPQESIRNAMTNRVITIGAHHYPSEAANEMRSNFIHHLVVVDEQRTVIGVLSSLDLLAEVT